MMSYWLDKLLAADDDNNLTKLVPLLIFFVIWVVGAVAKAAQKGKKGAETEPERSEEGHEPGFDELAKKIRERYSIAKEQANRGAPHGEKTGYQPPARTPQVRQPPPRRPMPEPDKIPVISPRQDAQSTEGPTLRVVKGLEKPAVNVRVGIEKPRLEKVEPGLQKVEGITTDVPMVSTEAGAKQPHYLTELATQYSTADGFRKAILNYEILGPPLALRRNDIGYNS
jgi:hypothetical protein